MPGLSSSSWPTVPPPPVTKLNTPGGRTSESTRQLQARVRRVGGRLEDDGVAGEEAAPAGPPASAMGKLNGAITAHTPRGLSTLTDSSLKPGRPIGFG